MEKFIVMLQNWKTTLASILPILGSVAIAFGWIDLEQQTVIINGVDTVLTSVESMTNEVIGIIAAVSGIGLLFAKDGDKSSRKLGID